MKHTALIFIIIFSYFSLGYGANKAAFIHGFWGDETSWGESGTIAYLLSEGIIDSHINIAYDTENQSPQEIADSVVSKIVAATQFGDKWIIIGHSLGGLIGRFVETTLNSNGIPIVGLLTLAAPHQGATAANVLANDAEGIVTQFTNDAKDGPEYGAHSLVEFGVFLMQWMTMFSGDNEYAQVYEIPYLLDDAHAIALDWIELADSSEAEIFLSPGNGTLITSINGQSTMSPHRSIIGSEQSPTIIRWMSELGYFGNDLPETDMVEYYNDVKDWYSANTHAYKNDRDFAAAKIALTGGIGYLFWYDQWLYFNRRYHAWKRGYSAWNNIDNTWAQAIGAGEDYTYTTQIWHPVCEDDPTDPPGSTNDVESMFIVIPGEGCGDGYWETVTVHVPVARKNDGLVSPNLAVWEEGQNKNDQVTNFYYSDEGSDGGYNHSEIRRAERAYTKPGVFQAGDETPQWLMAEDWMDNLYGN